MMSLHHPWTLICTALKILRNFEFPAKISNSTYSRKIFRFHISWKYVVISTEMSDSLSILTNFPNATNTFQKLFNWTRNFSPLFQKMSEMFEFLTHIIDGVWIDKSDFLSILTIFPNAINVSKNRNRNFSFLFQNFRISYCFCENILDSVHTRLMIH